MVWLFWLKSISIVVIDSDQTEYRTDDITVNIDTVIDGSVPEDALVCLTDSVSETVKTPADEKKEKSCAMHLTSANIAL
jgi:hypothetical protein